MRRLAGALVVVFCTATTARSATIAARFVEGGSDRPVLTGVEWVAVRPADSSVVAHVLSDSDGRARLVGLGAGHYRLRAMMLGHLPWSRADVMIGDSLETLDLGTIVLGVSPVAIKGVTTTTDRPTAIVGPDRNIYVVKDQPAASGGTAVDLLRTLPELEVDLNGNVTLRGAGSVNVQFNGRTAPLRGEALANWLRQTPASRLERVEVISNPSAKYDPEGAGGILNLILKDDTKLGASGTLGGSLGNAWTGPTARFAWQGGPLTVYGGGFGSVGSTDYRSEQLRTSRLVDPSSVYRSVSHNDSKSGFGNADASADLVLSKRFTLYGTANVNGNANGSDVRSVVDLTESPDPLRFSRHTRAEFDQFAPSATVGLQQVIEKSRHERSLEILISRGATVTSSDGSQSIEVPADSLGPRSHQGTVGGSLERSIQFDDSQPLGPKSKLEFGARGLDRRTTESGVVDFTADSGVVTPADSRSDWEHRESFLSGYLTFGTTIRKFSAQIGARGEWAHTRFDVRTSGHRFAHDYRSLFPSLNVAWDVGTGRSIRFTYGKRIERPTPNLLNPEPPVSDSLNRFVGEPSLGPRYTHVFTLEANWNGSKGSIRLAPYARLTFDNWDNVIHVEPSGALVSTYANASRLTQYGTNLTLSLRQLGRLSGSLTTGVWREHHDASNVAAGFVHDLTNVSLTLNVTEQITKALDLQFYQRYSPAQTTAQGRSSGFPYCWISLREKLGPNASLSLMARDPFDQGYFWAESGDATYSLHSRSHTSSIRGLTVSFWWNWGKPPQQLERKQTASSGSGNDAPR